MVGVLVHFQGLNGCLFQGGYPVPKEATRCFTAVATLEGEDKGNAREATMTKIGWMRLACWLACLIVVLGWGLLYR